MKYLINIGAGILSILAIKLIFLFPNEGLMLVVGLFLVYWLYDIARG